MKTRFLLFIVVVCILSCKKNDLSPVDNNPPDSGTKDIIAEENSRLSETVTKETSNAYITGLIEDENGKPLVGVSVSAGSNTVVTKDKGTFQFPSIVSVNKNYALITASKAGYFSGFKTFTPGKSGMSNHYLVIRLLKEGDAKTVSSSGGDIILDEKIHLTFPESAVTTESGTVYRGDFKVAGRYIDPQADNFFQTIPGLLAGLNDENQLRALESFGMANVVLKDMSGNMLQVAPGKKVKMELPANADAPATVPLWHFNEKYGLWIKAGEATKTGNFYSAEVNHFSIWNLDLDKTGFSLDVRLVDTAGHALAGMDVAVYTQAMKKVASFYSDNEGKATLLKCPASEPLILKTIFHCDTIINTIEPVTGDRSEDVVLHGKPELFKTYVVSGKLTDCDGKGFPGQPFLLGLLNNGTGITIPAVTDAEGNYSIGAQICNSGDFATIQAYVFANNDYRFAPATLIASGTSVYDAKICDTIPGNPDDLVVIFPDSSLNAVIREIINKPSGDLLYGDVKNIDYIYSTPVDISNLSGIQFCVNLKELDLYTHLKDLSLLQNLKKLEHLEIWERSGALIDDISPLQNLTNLTFLSINCQNLVDISPLNKLAQLTNLYLYSKSLTDVNPLSNMLSLRTLTFACEGLSDISPIKNLINLTSVTLSKTQVANIGAVASLVNLTQFFANRCKVSDVSPLKNLLSLKMLGLEENYITDITPLITGIPAVTSFDILNQVTGDLPAGQKSDFIVSHPLTQISWN